MVHHNKYTKKRSHLNKDGTRRNRYVYKGGENTPPQEENSQPTLLGTIGNSFNSTMGKLGEAVSGTPSKENTVTPDEQNTVTPQLQTSPPVTPPNEKVDDDNEMEEMKSYTMELVNTLKEKEEIENKLTTLLATMPAAFNEPIQEETSLVKDETMSSPDEEESQQDEGEGSQQDDMSVESYEKTSQQDEDEEDNTSVGEDNTSVEQDNMSVENDEEGSPVSFNPNDQEKQEQ